MFNIQHHTVDAQSTNVHLLCDILPKMHPQHETYWIIYQTDTVTYFVMCCLGTMKITTFINMQVTTKLNMRPKGLDTLLI